jgi:excisionase family DNA binding protein
VQGRHGAHDVHTRKDTEEATMTGSQPDLGQLEPLYTTTEVARALRVSRDTISRWIRLGKLDAVKVGNGFRIKKSVADALLNEIGLSATAEPVTA